MPQNIPRTSAVLSFTTSEKTHTFTTEAVAYLIWTTADVLILEEDNAIDASSFRIPANTLYGPARPCKVLHYKGATGSGTAYLKWLPRISSGKSDWEMWDQRGGVDL